MPVRTRTLTGTIDDTGAGVLTCTLLETIISDAIVVPAQTFRVAYSDATPFSVALPVPDSGTASYLLMFPNTRAYTVYLAQGAAVDLSTLIAVSGLPVADTAAVVSAHAATIASTTTLGHVKVDGTTIVIDPSGTIQAVGSAPATASYVTISAETALTNERTLTAGQNITLTDGGPGGNVTIASTGLPAITAVRSGTTTLFGFPNLNATSQVTRAIIASRIYYMPFVIHSAITINAMQCDVVTGVAGTVRLGIARLTNTGQPQATGGVVVDAGTVDCGTAGLKTITGLNATLTPGWYATLVQSDVNPTLRAVRASISTFLFDTWGSDSLIATMRATRAHTPFTDPLPVWTVADASNGFEHMVALRWSVS